MSSDSESEGGDGGGLLGKIVISAVVVVAAIPGLVVEPGPFSEMAALGVLAAVWLGDESPSEAAAQVAEESAD